MGTLGNSFGRKETGYGGGKHIWHEIRGAYPVGGTISNYADYQGKVIPAGSMCQYDQATKTIKIVKASDIKTGEEEETGTVDATAVKGLLERDVYVDATADGVANAVYTGCVVFAGEIYSDRLAEAVPDSVWGNLPMIVQIKEKGE